MTSHYQFQIETRSSAAYEAAAALVAHQYQKHFGSERCHVPAHLLCQREKGQLVGCVGFEHATDALFLEQYLDHPVERSVSAAIGEPVARDQIVEIGAFAVCHRRHALALMMELASVLDSREFRIAVCTVTGPVRGCLRKLGIDSFELAVASRDRVADATAWGRYYDLEPSVLAGNIADGLRHIELLRPLLVAEVA